MAINPATVNCLADPTAQEQIPWKRDLFYALGYCDTFHDFSKPRSTEDKGKSINPKLIPKRADFTTGLIGEIDSGFTWNTTYYKKIDDFRKSKKYGTFENAMFGIFTTAKDSNPIFASFPEGSRDSIKTHIKATVCYEDYIIDSLDENTFKTETNVNPSNVFIEMTAPEIVYSEAWRANFVNFLMSAYSTQKDADGKLRFIEDAAAFPRNIFTGTSPNFSQFKKVVTIQTKWDPAGLSGYEYNREPIAENTILSAPSFIAEKDRASAGNLPFDKSSFFHQTDNYIQTPSNKITITKAGPSVNHLFMHIAYHKSGANASEKKIIENMIARAVLDKGSKNMTYKLNKTADTEPKKNAEVRKLTASKRSGDYESIHSALKNNAVLFTGDEPAFTYAVLNNCPAVYHICTSSGHFFRFYIPRVLGPAEMAADKEFQDAVTESSEIEKILGDTTVNFKAFIDNITKYCEPGSLRIRNNALAGKLFQCLILEYIIKVKDIFLKVKGMTTEYRKIEEQYQKKLTSLIEILKGIPKNPTQAQKDQVTGARSEQRQTISELQAAVTKGEKALDAVRLVIPKNFIRDDAHMKPIRPDFFVKAPSALSATAVYKKNAITEYIMFAPISFLPELKTVGQSITGIASMILQIERLGDDPSKKDMRIAIMEQIQDALISLSASETLSNFFAGDVFFSLDSDEAIAAATPAAVAANDISTFQKYFRKTVADFDILKTQLQAQGGGRRNNYKSKKNNTRKNYKPFDPANPNQYLEMASSIAKSVDSKSLPFGLDSESYAALLVDRLMSLETLNEVFGKKATVSFVEATDPILLEQDDYDVISPEKLEKDYSKQRLDLINEDPIVTIQSGGSYSETVNPIDTFVMELFYDHIEPFVRLHFEGHAVFSKYLLYAIYAGSFISDMFDLLDTLTSIPDAEYFEQGLEEGNPLKLSHGKKSAYERMKTRANEAKLELYAAIQELIPNARKCILRQKFGYSVASVADMKTICKKHEREFNFEEICNKTYSICTFLSRIIKGNQEQGVGNAKWQEGRETYFRKRYNDVCTKIETAAADRLDTILENSKDKKQKVFDTLKYPFVDWYTFQFKSTEDEGVVETLKKEEEVPDEDNQLAVTPDVVDNATELNVKKIDEEEAGAGVEEIAILSEAEKYISPPAAEEAPAPQEEVDGGRRRSRKYRRKRYSPRRRSLKNRYR